MFYIAVSFLAMIVKFRGAVDILNLQLNRKLLILKTACMSQFAKLWEGLGGTVMWL